MAVKQRLQKSPLPAAPSGSRKTGKESGLALILVLSLIAIITTVVSEIIFQSEITARSAVGERDKAKAEMAALAGAQFAMMLVSLDTTAQSLPPALQKPFEQMLGGKKLYEFLNGLPIGQEGLDSIKDLANINLSAALDTDIMTLLKSVPGYFVLNVSNESAKLNVNNLHKGSSKGGMEKLLLRLFSGTHEAKFLEEKGYPPKRLVANLVDYIDANNTDSSDGSPEQNQYEKLKFPHLPKNAPLQSLDELRRIPGFHDDDIFSIFAPYLTVWPLDPPDTKVFDIRGAAPELVALLLTKEGSDPNPSTLDKYEDDRQAGSLPSTGAEAGADRDFRKYWDDIAGGIDGQIYSLLGSGAQVFKIEVKGYSNNVERTYQMIIDRNKTKSKQAGGAPLRVVYQRFF